MISERNKLKLDGYRKAIKKNEVCCKDKENQYRRYIKHLENEEELPFYTSETCSCLVGFGLSDYRGV